MKHLLPLLLVSLFLCGCASVNVSHDYDPQIDLAMYESFDLLPIPHPEYDEKARMVLGNDDSSLLALTSILEGKGYHRAIDGPADFFVGIRATFRSIEEVIGYLDAEPEGLLAMSVLPPNRLGNTDADYPRSIYRPTDLDIYDASEGSRLPSDQGVYLIIDVFDATTKSLAWQGWAKSSTVNGFATDSKRVVAISKVLESFPN
ncbi:DUF4136 domain-containing protein [Pelagicoccus sp. SDUM812003]|uniref:DUF4136 domain-containing protein n=1 Tax=Pelagicoccus sp. SDUM812003 TaxID=3041267 RepID=UPI00280FDE6B|nr:DUF4136 domain-containing protein [Pelagicoccus sp. SDUM812003]MDQ8204878.1 DUF4136 domain-containing protein [Pelagicoccus sp. SDUM812003]